MLPIVFSRTHTIGSLAVRFVTWGTWSHCGLLTPDNTVIEAAWPHGVVETPLEDHVRKKSNWAIRQTPCANPLKALAWARTQLGKPYDMWGAVGLGLHREWDKDDAWWCSEFIAKANAEGDTPLYARGMRRVTPEHIWWLAQ